MELMGALSTLEFVTICKGFRHCLFLASQIAEENLLNRLKKMNRLLDQDTDSGVCSSRLSGVGTVASSCFSILSQVFFRSIYGCMASFRSELGYLILTPE